MSRSQRIREILSQAFDPIELDVIDESHLHAGHAGARPEGETHFRLHIVASTFETMTRVQRHRAVMRALQTEFDAGLHALAIAAEIPSPA
ncbi:MAG: BolA family protein [Pseudomonadota bacterium]